jgi:predicted MFS family arabinose efflux permease
MTSTQRALNAVGAIAGGWVLMTVAYDKPEWFFQAAGVIGVILVLGALVWWPVSARRAKTMDRHGDSSGEANGA